LSDPVGLAGRARGIAFRLVENFGTLRRDAIADELKALEQMERASLRQHGVRFGAFNVYVPALLKPAAADLLVLLWTLHSGRDHGIALDALPPRPQQGLTSVEADRRVPEPYWRVAGFHLAGARAVRIDMLERLADLIRVRVAYRSGGEQPGPSGATGDGGFRVVSDLMSVVGCSGEDFASILRSFGFKRERRKLAPEKVATEADAAPTPEAFEDIWRPSRRKDQSERPARHRGKQAPGKVKRDGRKRPPPQPTPRREEHKVSRKNPRQWRAGPEGGAPRRQGRHHHGKFGAPRRGARARLCRAPGGGECGTESVRGPHSTTGAERGKTCRGWQAADQA
jgi:ATP-dependent RNA helicase SUPV3L1/SUV3